MLKSKNILVTGGAGFIGSNLCHFLTNKGFKVVCLDNFDDFYSEKTKQNNINGLRGNPLFDFVKGDIRNSNLLDNIFSNHQIDFVIHLAAKAGVRNSIYNPQEYFDVNVNGSICLFETMRKHNVKNLVFASSSSVYGNKNGKLDETEICDNQISPYAVSKRTVELLAYSYHVNFEINVINLRLFSVYGRRQRPDLVIHKFIDLILKNKPIEIYGSCQTRRDYTHIDDVLRAIHSAIKFLKKEKKNNYEIINIGNDRPISLERLIDLIKKYTHNSNIQIIMKEFVKGEAKSTHANIDKARKLLKYSPKVEIKEGISRYFKWYIEQLKN